MKIAVDIDGVIADFVGSFLPFLNTLRKTKHRREDIVNYKFHVNVKVQIEEPIMNEIFKLFKQKGNYKRLKLMNGCAKVLTKISKGNEIVIISSRGRNLEAITKDWLSNYNVPFKDLILVDNEVEKVLQMIKCDLAIEDNLETARMVEAEGIPVLLFDYPWNKLGKQIQRIKGWGEVVKKLNEVGMDRTSSKN